MAEFLPLRDICSSSDDEDDNSILTDDVDGAGKAFQKYYTKFIEKFGSRKRARAKRKRATETDGKDRPTKPPVDEHEYDFYNPRRGMAIVINNDTFHVESGMGNREGSKDDARGLVTMFKQLGFDVSVYNNRTTREIVDILKEAASNREYDHNEADCFACAILSHGGEEVFNPRDSRCASKVRNDVVFGVDGKLVPTRYLLSIFNDECCPELEGKPRLFFVQACRGSKMDDGMKVTVIRRKKKQKQAIQKQAEDEQDAKIYISDSEDDTDEDITSGDAGEDDDSSVPGNKGDSVHPTKDGDMSVQEPQGNKEQPRKDEKTKSESHPTEDAFEIQIHKEQQTIDGNVASGAQESERQNLKGSENQEQKGQKCDDKKPVEETQGPEESTTANRKGDIEREVLGGESKEMEIKPSKTSMEKQLTISPSPIYKDFLLVYASPPGYFAWRRKNGGWLIQTLVSVLRTADVTSVPLTRLLTTVSRRVAIEFQSSSRKHRHDRKKVIPCVMSMLTKDLYFRSKTS